MNDTINDFINDKINGRPPQQNLKHFQALEENCLFKGVFKSFGCSDGASWD